MFSNRFITCGLAVLCLIMASTRSFSAEVATQVKLSDLPAAVQKTLLREADGATIDEVDKVSKHGRILYEADVKIDGTKYEIVVSEEGLLISKKIDDEGEDEDEDE